MATYYVASGITGSSPHPVTGRVDECGPDTADTITGSDSNNGTSTATPFLTLAKLQTLNTNTGPANGDTVYIRGRFRQTTQYQYTMTDNSSGVTWAQWPGGAPAILKGMTLAGTTGWTNTAGTYTKTITAGLTIRGVAWEYDDTGSIDVTSRTQEGIVGRRIAWLPSKTALQLAGGAVVGYNYTSPVLTVVLPFSADPSAPNANGVEYAVANRSGIGFVGSSTNDLVTSSITVDGLTFQGYVDGAAAAPAGCCVFIANGNLCTIKNNRFEDSGIHSVSFGSRVTNNVLMDNFHCGEGCGGIHAVFDPTGTTGGQANTATGCRIYRDKFYINPPLAADGTLAYSGAAVGAVIYHGNVSDVKCYDIQIFEYTPTSGNAAATSPFTLGDTASPGTETDYTTYGIQFVQTNPNIYVLYNSVGQPSQGTTCNVAFVNCRFDFGQLKSSGLNRQVCYGFSSEVGSLLFIGCTFAGDMGNPAGPIRMFSLGTLGNIITINCSGMDTGATHGAQIYSIFHFLAAGSSVKDYGSVWAFASTTTGTRYYTSGDAAIDETFRQVEYVKLWNIGGGVGGTTFTQNAAFNTDAEFLATYPNTTILTAAPFTSVAAGSALVPTTAIRAMRRRINPHATRGVNGRVYDGTPGAYQYGGGAFRSARIAGRTGRPIMGVR